MFKLSQDCFSPFMLTSMVFSVFFFFFLFFFIFLGCVPIILWELPHFLAQDLLGSFLLFVLQSWNQPNLWGALDLFNGETKIWVLEWSSLLGYHYSNALLVCELRNICTYMFISIYTCLPICLFPSSTGPLTLALSHPVCSKHPESKSSLYPSHFPQFLAQRRPSRNIAGRKEGMQEQNSPWLEHL